MAKAARRVCVKNASPTEKKKKRKKQGKAEKLAHQRFRKIGKNVTWTGGICSFQMTEVRHVCSMTQSRTLLLYRVHLRR